MRTQAFLLLLTFGTVGAAAVVTLIAGMRGVRLRDRREGDTSRSRRAI